LLLQLLMVRWAQRFGSPLLPIGGFGWDAHIILPALVLAARPIAQITRMTSIGVGDVLDQDYVRTAMGKGLWPRQIWGRHVIRNAAIPILTTIGLSLRFSLSSLPVVELFFGWPGLGSTLLKSITLQDNDLTVALVLSLGVIFILVNLILEVSYRAIDPRLRKAGDLARRREEGLLDHLRSLVSGIQDFLVSNPIQRWWQARRQEPAPSPFKQVAEIHGNATELSPEIYRSERRRAWWRGTMGNLPLILGTIIVLMLLVSVFFGPALSPHSPYTTRGLTIVDGEFLMPPFAPDETFPLGTDVLGRDIWSLILSGAQQTLLLAGLVVVARLLVGFVLGALAGWLHGTWLDRLILAAAEIIAAFPTLILAMILILALGIREGMRTFVIALCFVGWGEIMQFVRGEVMGIRPKLFIESATAAGLSTLRIVLRHVLPILVSALISIAALEMGAVLMLLGELGFISIFIGGGAFAELDIGGAIYHYSDVPEWGSLLSSVRAYARAYPWVAIYPAFAFFIAIVGFNLFGEGLRRMVETVGIGLGKVLNRYTLAAAVIALLALGWARSNTGSLAYFRQQARFVDGRQAYTYVDNLTSPDLESRSLGSQGMQEAAQWIADQFQALGLQPAGQGLTYFQDRRRSFEELDSVPQLQIQDGQPAPSYRRDFLEYPGYYRNTGQVEGEVRVVLAANLDPGNFRRRYPQLQEVIGEDDVVLAITPQEAAWIEEIPYGGLLAVAENPRDLQRSYTLSSRSPYWQAFGTGREYGKESPAIWISEDVANRLLATTGETVESLQRRRQGLEDGEVLDLWTGQQVSMTVRGTGQEGVPASHVLGYLPGAAGRAQAGEAQLDNQLVVILAQYDSPPSGLDGCCPAANDNASGVGVMLEVIRAIQESGYQPYRTLLFVAYAGEGLDGGEVVRPEDVSRFLQAKAGFATSFDVEAVVHLRGLGAGQGDHLQITAGGNQRLASVFEAAARRSGAAIRRQEETVDISTVYAERYSLQGGGQEAPTIRLSWAGWDVDARTADDTMAQISAEKLEEAGRTLALALMVIGREQRY
jgi:peptide/nickel transport system permease protein